MFSELIWLYVSYSKILEPRKFLSKHIIPKGVFFKKQELLIPGIIFEKYVSNRQCTLGPFTIQLNYLSCPKLEKKLFKNIKTTSDIKATSTKTKFYIKSWAVKDLIYSEVFFL